MNWGKKLYIPKITETLKKKKNPVISFLKIFFECSMRYTAQ